MAEAPIVRRFREAKAAKRRYMLICFDTYDRMRGDADLGYFYPAFDTEEEVRQFLKGKQLCEWTPRNLADCCEAVIDLERTGTELFPGDSQKPQEWLAKRRAKGD